MSRFQFVADHHRAYGVKRLCRLLHLSRSGYYRWSAARAGRAERDRSDRALGELITKVHAESHGTYGRPRITAELNESGTAVNHKRVGRLMRELGITGVHLRKPVRTTIPPARPGQLPDLLERDFTAPAPNTRYVGDITYLPLAGGRFLYLATVIDLYSRRLTGWSIADHMRTDLVTDALKAAAATRHGNLHGAIFHSDNGGQYASNQFTTLCERLGVIRSRGKVGTSADNAAAEAFNATLKRETLQGANTYPDPHTARQTVFAWLTRYNTRRRHSTLDYHTPIDYEHRTTTLTLAA